MFDAFMDMGVSSKGEDLFLRGEFISKLTMIYVFMDVGVSDQGLTTDLREE